LNPVTPGCNPINVAVCNPINVAVCNPVNVAVCGGSKPR